MSLPLFPLYLCVVTALSSLPLCHCRSFRFTFVSLPLFRLYYCVVTALSSLLLCRYRSFVFTSVSLLLFPLYLCFVTALSSLPLCHYRSFHFTSVSLLLFRLYYCVVTALSSLQLCRYRSFHFTSVSLQQVQSVWRWRLYCVRKSLRPLWGNELNFSSTFFFLSLSLSFLSLWLLQWLLLLLFKYFIYPFVGNSGRLTWVKLQQLQEQCYLLLTLRAVVSCFQTIVWLPVLGIFHVRTAVKACDCTRGV